MLRALLILIIVTIISIIFIKKETFTNYNNINIKFCPFNSDSHIYKGETICCKGEFSDNLGCLEKTVCSLSSDSSTVPSCGKMYRNYLTSEAIKFCPNKMPSYYEESTGKKYCYGGQSSEDGVGPIKPTEQPRCPVYKNEKDYSDPKSCYNLKQLDSLPCFTPGEICEKNIIPVGNNIPSLVSQTFMGSNVMPGGVIMKMPRTCYYDEPARRYLNVVSPSWNKHFKFEDSPDICSTANEMFVKMSKKRNM